MGHVGFRVPHAQLDQTLRVMEAQQGNYKFKGKDLTIVAVDPVHSGRFSMPEAPPPEDSMSSDVSEASEVTEQVTLQDLMRKMNTMEKRHKRSEKKLKNELQVYVQNTVTDTVAPLSAEIQQLSIGQVLLDNRVGALENVSGDIEGLRSDMRNLKVGSGVGPDKHDPNHLRIAFKGFSTENLDERVGAIKGFIEKHQGKDAYVCIDTRTKGGFDDRKLTDESFAQFGTRDARDRVLKAIKERNFKTAKGNTVKIDRSKTEWQRGRDWAMRKSEDLIKGKIQSAGSKGETVKFEKAKDWRKITVNGGDAFVQRREDRHGNFVGNFADLSLP